jgi:hypothetical protein
MVALVVGHPDGGVTRGSTTGWSALRTATPHDHSERWRSEESGLFNCPTAARGAFRMGNWVRCCGVAPTGTIEQQRADKAPARQHRCD